MKPCFDVVVAQCAFDVRKASILCCTSRIPSATAQERRTGAGAGMSALARLYAKVEPPLASVNFHMFWVQDIPICITQTLSVSRTFRRGSLS